MIQLNPRYSDVPSYSFPLTNIDLNYNEFDNRKKEERFLLNKGSIISRTDRKSFYRSLLSMKKQNIQ
ncbi:hypothetical protein FVD43_02110, partial [Enterococcus faecium]|nr:hypothetical protein [Enterococcus faecium]